MKNTYLVEKKNEYTFCWKKNDQNEKFARFYV